uniref:Mannosylglycerate hydrolase MGH1-like glycoside hydrolase domain-containing protein n=1 Tax=Rhodosorus marinus TaxID=101924 RepID=A0A7S3EDQ6_9RHOD|mmetsp:Transcript_27879/g.109392  ORF Transcript_27879/g.109392 Transcript_27879/m.109392 type:complete len:541 (+) Transcript_27879:436-2058(+)
MRMFRIVCVVSVMTAILFSHRVIAQEKACVGSTQQEKELLSGARKVLNVNWMPEMNSTLPSANLYPHQWSWDSAFIAFGYAHYDIVKAKEEMRSLFRAQWKNGLVPHIVFNPQTSGSYFPGPKYWKTSTSPNAVHDPETTGIVQPAVHAIAVLKTYEASGDIEYLKEMFPLLKKWHDYLYRERDIHGEHLVFVRHPWETGMDNAPSWDDAFNRIELKEGDVPPYKRADNKHSDVDASDRPTDFYYDRYVYLMKIFYDNNYDEAQIAAKCPYLIQDVLFNTILSKAEDTLADIAVLIGKPSAEFRTRAEKTRTAILEKMWNAEDAAFYDYDLYSDEVIKKRIGGAMAGIYGVTLPKNDMKNFLAVLDSEEAMGRLGNQTGFPLPTMLTNEETYMPNNYWRGPVWININYMVIEGLLSYGTEEALETAQYLFKKTLDLVQVGGFFEYFSALDASPHGGGDFSWTASLVVDMICDPDKHERLTAANADSKGSEVLYFSGLTISVLIGGLTVAVIRKRLRGGQVSTYEKQSFVAEGALTDLGRL